MQRFTRPPALSQGKLLPGLCTRLVRLRRKDNSSQGYRKRHRVLAYDIYTLPCPMRPTSEKARPHSIQVSGSGILTRYPFERRCHFRLGEEPIGHAHPFEGSEHICTLTNQAFAHLLGPTHPRPNAVHVEPFSTSAFKVIPSHLNNCYYHQDLHQGQLQLSSRFSLYSL